MVAPLAGAWIETTIMALLVPLDVVSHPSRVRGLKHGCYHSRDIMGLVAPLAGAWIETLVKDLAGIALKRRTPRGCVD